MTPSAIAGLCVFGAVTVGSFAISERVVSRNADATRVTVLYWEKWTGPEGEEMRKVVDDFNKSQDKIFVRYLSISGVDTKTLLGASGGNPPDIAGVWQENVGPFADAGALTDLTQMAEVAGLTPDYYIRGYYDPLTYRSGLWALPSTPASIALHVRPDLVPPENASPETFPKTLEDLDALTFRISKTNPDGNLKLAGFLPSNPGWWNWAWPYIFGGQLVNGDKLTIETPEALRAFQWVAKYSKHFGSSAVTSFQGGFGNFAGPGDPFMSGKVSTEINGVWKGKYIKDFRPQTPWFAVPFPYPADRPDLADHAILSQDVLAIPRGAKHPKEAFEFIRFVQRQDVMEGLCSSHGKNSPLAKVSEHFFETHPNKAIRLFDKLARSPNAFYPPVMGLVRQIRDEMDVVFQKVNTGQDSPAHALHDAQTRLDGQWAVYKSQVLGR